MSDTEVKVTQQKIFNPLSNRYIVVGGQSYKNLLREGYLDPVSFQPTHKLTDYVENKSVERKERLLRNKLSKESKEPEEIQNNLVDE